MGDSGSKTLTEWLKAEAHRFDFILLRIRADRAKSNLLTKKLLCALTFILQREGITVFVHVEFCCGHGASNMVTNVLKHDIEPLCQTWIV